MFSSPLHPDQDFHKGSIEGSRQDDEQHCNPHGSGVDENGLPNDPVGEAEDVLGAEVDQTQG